MLYRSDGSSTQKATPPQGSATETSAVASNTKADKPAIFMSNYKASTKFAGNIHKSVGQQGIDTKFYHKQKTKSTNTELQQKEGSVIKDQSAIKGEAKGKIESGVIEGEARSFKEDITRHATNIKNRHYEVTGQPEKVQPQRTIVQEAVDIDDKSLKITQNKKSPESQKTEVVESNVKNTKGGMAEESYNANASKEHSANSPSKVTSNNRNVDNKANVAHTDNNKKEDKS